jgi:hypothetical protein
VHHIPNFSGKLVPNVDPFQADDTKEGGLREQLGEDFLE